MTIICGYGALYHARFARVGAPLKINKDERSSAKTKTKKREEKEKKEYTRKKGKEAKNYTQALRKVKCAYTKKSDFSLEVNTERDFNDS